jgi:hypothetical protein
MQVKVTCYRHGVICAPGFGGRKKATDVVMFSLLRFCKIEWGINGSLGLQKRRAMWSYVSGYWN